MHILTKEQNKLFIFILLCRSVCLTNFLSFFYTDFFKFIGVALMGSKHCVAFQWRKYYQDFYFPDPRPPKPDSTPDPQNPTADPKTRPRHINSLFERLADIETLLGVVIKRCSIHTILILCHGSYKKLYSKQFFSSGGRGSQ